MEFVVANCTVTVSLTRNAYQFEDSVVLTAHSCRIDVTVTHGE